MKKLLIASLALLTLSACTHPKVEVDKLQDGTMSCHQISAEISDLRSMKREVEGNRGMSGRNVGMALLFWPGIIVNEMNGSESEKLISERMTKLVALSNKKGCGN